MKIRTKVILITPLVAMLVLACAAPLLSGCATTREYSTPFATTEASLYDALHLDKTQVLSNTVMAQAKAEGELERSMSMRLYAIDVHTYIPDKRLSFTLYHRYDIGANGAEYIRFDIIAKQSDITEVTVNYTDRWVGMWPPFAFLNPGPFREKNIHRLIWQTGLPTTDSTLSTEGAPSVEK